MRRELFHHGVPGQQWGVRNGPPYPIEDKVLRKGTKLNSVSHKHWDSKDYAKSGKWMYMYNPNDEWDNKVYKGPFSKYLICYRGARFIREHEYELVKDLKMPTKKERVEEFNNLLNDKKYSKVVKQDLDKYQKMLVQYKVGNEKEQKQFAEFDPNNIKTDKDLKVAYAVFNHAMEAVHANESTKEYAKRMSKKYDAMVDDNNQGIYNDAHDPVIIFRAHEVLKDISDPKSPKYLSMQEIMENTEIIRKELEKQGKKVKL